MFMKTKKVHKYNERTILCSFFNIELIYIIVGGHRSNTILMSYNYVFIVSKGATVRNPPSFS